MYLCLRSDSYVCVFLVLGFVLKTPNLLFRQRMCVCLCVWKIEGSLRPQSALLNEKLGQKDMCLVTSWRLSFYLQSRFEKYLTKHVLTCTSLFASLRINIYYGVEIYAAIRPWPVTRLNTNWKSEFSLTCDGFI